MSKITDFADRQKVSDAAIDAKLDVIGKGVLDLDAAIKALNNSSGTLSVLDQAALDDLEARSTALVAKVNAIDTTAPVPDAPAPVV